MFLVLILILGIALIPATRAMCESRHFSRMVTLVVGSYALRLLINVLVSRSVAFFSHGMAGGDGLIYEHVAQSITAIWETQGVSFVTVQELPDLGELRNTAFVCNLYAAVIYLCGDSTVACTAVVAFIACLLSMIVYRFCQTIGASEGAAFKAFLLTIFGPSFVYHTSDTYKDGINAFLVVTTVYLAVLLSKKFSALWVALLVPVLWALWNVRPYMVFMSLLPVAVGLVGLRAGSDQKLSPRNIAMITLMVIVGIGAVGYGATQGVFGSAEAQFSQGTSEATHQGNLDNGASGVSFDDGGNPWGALGPKMLYTIFSPFPWMGGSMGLQIGKLDALIWYYIIYGAVRAAALAWRRDKPTLMMLMLFIGPGTIAYSLSMANVGLILRQRMPIMMVTTVLASLYWTQSEKAPSKGWRPNMSRDLKPATAAVRSIAA